MIYSFHHFYYWLRGGVESGMAYRAKIFRQLGLDARFVFATTFPDNNIWRETEYLGFLNSETMWLYGFFTDCKNSAKPYTLEQLEEIALDDISNRKSVIDYDRYIREKYLGDLEGLRRRPAGTLLQN